MNKVILMLFFLISAIAACVEEPKYNREQCIVRVNIEWENMSDAHKENIIVIITNAIRSAPDMDFNRIPPGFSVKGTDREFIYYQHEFDCENRLANMEKLLSYVRSNTGHFSLP
ncbi:MAG: hypothetical protein J4G09_09475 [Proteobacteria bacterium]|nr:hypothetical protein [Pseudomonadota bacterium]